MGQTTLPELFDSKQAGMKGDASVLDNLKKASVEFDARFEIVPRPAKGQEVDAHFYRQS